MAKEIKITPDFTPGFVEVGGQDSQISISEIFEAGVR